MLLIISLLTLQASGVLLIVARSNDPSVNEEALHPSTALPPPKSLLKVAVHSNGPNLTQR